MSNEFDILKQLAKDSCCHRCKVGICCEEPVWADVAEVKAMLDNYPLDKMKELKLKALEWYDRAKRSGLLELDNHDGSDERERTGDFTKTYAWRWRQMKLTCPFYESGKCSVYEHRPASCALFFAKGEPEFCGDDRRFTQSKVLEWPHKVIEAVIGSTYMNLKPESLALDHLGVVIYNILFSADIKTASRMDGHIKYLDDGIELTKKEEV